MAFLGTLDPGKSRGQRWGDALSDTLQNLAEGKVQQMKNRDLAKVYESQGLTPEQGIMMSRALGQEGLQNFMKDRSSTAWSQPTTISGGQDRSVSPTMAQSQPVPEKLNERIQYLQNQQAQYQAQQQQAQQQQMPTQQAVQNAILASAMRGGREMPQQGDPFAGLNQKVAQQRGQEELQNLLKQREAWYPQQGQAGGQVAPAGQSNLTEGLRRVTPTNKEALAERKEQKELEKEKRQELSKLSEEERQELKVQEKKKEEAQKSVKKIEQAQKLINDSNGKTSLGIMGNVTPLSAQPKELKQLQQIVKSLIPEKATEAARKTWEKDFLPTIYDSPEQQYDKLQMLKKQILEDAGIDVEKKMIDQEKDMVQDQENIVQDQQALQEGSDQLGEGYTGAPGQSTLGWLGQQSAGIANQLVGMPYNAAKFGAKIGEGLRGSVEDLGRKTMISSLENALEKGGDYLYGSDPKEVKKEIERLKKEEMPTPTTDAFKKADEKIKDFQEALFGKEYLTPKGDLEEGTQDIGASVGLALATGTPWTAVAQIAKRASQGVAAKQAMKWLGGDETAQVGARIIFPLLLDMFNPKNIMSKVQPVLSNRNKEVEKLAQEKTIDISSVKDSLEKVHNEALGGPQYSTYRKNLQILEGELGSNTKNFSIKDLPKIKERANRFVDEFDLEKFKPVVDEVDKAINKAALIVPAWGEEAKVLDKINSSLVRMGNAKTFMENFKDINSYRSKTQLAIKALKSLMVHPNVKGLGSIFTIGINDRELALKYITEALQAAGESQKGNFLAAASKLGEILDKKKK